MASCCSTSKRTSSTQSRLIVALAGNPNSGKTTLFNALTGLRQKVANYPGVTVEKKTGRCRLPDGRAVEVIDLPGAYSLISQSLDEQVATDVLRGLRPDTPAPDVVIVVVDASNLQRNLYLVSQLIELGQPMVMALNMMDIAERRGIRVSAERLEKLLGVPVVPVVGHRKQGIEALKAAISRAAVAPMPDWPLPAAMKEEVRRVTNALNDAKDKIGENQAISERKRIQAAALAERLLIGDHTGDLNHFRHAQGMAGLVAQSVSRLQGLGIDPMHADIEAHYHWIENVAAGALVPACEELDRFTADRALPRAPLEYARGRTLTERVDAVLIHHLWGLLIFAAVMASLFVTIFWVAAPMMDAVESAIAWIGEVATARLSDGPVKDLLVDGIFGGVGSVVVFVPQIALLFLFLAIMEDSGYLARAAFLMDKLLAKVGLHGKSFIPLLSSFACAIPGIMATRTIENRKDRLATIFVAPFMGCSARLPVYFLLVGTFFGAYSAAMQGGILFALYAIGVIAAAATAWCFKRTFLKGPTPAFILEMPTYKVPQLSQVARTVWVNTKAFLVKAGTVIFVLSIILWAMTYYPRLPEERVEQIHTFHKDPANFASANEAMRQEEAAVSSEQLRYSLAGRFGHLIEPVIKPLGYDWKMGVGLVGAFAAREVFVSTLAITYNAGSEDETGSLSDAMRSDAYPDGTKVWTPLVATSLLVWFALAMQCMSTLAIVRRETGGWRWPVFMLVYMNGLAYLASLAMFQIGRIWWN